MKNTLMIALLVAVPVALHGMEPANDPLETLKGICNVETDEALANYVRIQVPVGETVENAVLIKALQHLGRQNKLAELQPAVAPKRAAVVDGASDESAEGNKISALQAAVAILQGVVAVVTDPNNQQQVQQAGDQLAKAGCKNCSIL